AWQRFRLPIDQPYSYRQLTGTYEPETTRLVHKLVRPGMTVVDVGASVGYYSRLCGRLVGSRGRVYAFEPHPTIVELLRHNVRGYPQVVVYPLAVAARRTVTTLYIGRSGAH